MSEKTHTIEKEGDQPDYKTNSSQSETIHSSSPHPEIGERESKDSVNIEEDQSVTLGYDVNPDGSIGLSFEAQRYFDIAQIIGNLGRWLNILRLLMLFVGPLLYYAGIILTPGLLVVIMTSPFPVGSALINLANNPEYFPWAGNK